jgi:hypothetical protein
MNRAVISHRRRLKRQQWAAVLFCQVLASASRSCIGPASSSAIVLYCVLVALLLFLFRFGRMQVHLRLVSRLASTRRRFPEKDRDRSPHLLFYLPSGFGKKRIWLQQKQQPTGLVNHPRSHTKGSASARYY